MPSIFSRIVAGEIPCHLVWEDEEHLAFLDIQPWSEGHTLVIPKREEDYLFDLSPQRAEALWSAAHKVEKLLKAKVKCQRVAVLVLGYEVPHAHIHLIPTQSEREVLAARRAPTDHAALAALASQLRGAESEELRAEDGDQTSDERRESPTTESVAARWDEFATRFVAEAEPVTLRVARAAMEHLRLDHVESVLEVGSGGGAAGLELRRLLDLHSPQAHLTLTDISAEMTRLAQERLEREDPNRDKRARGELGGAQVEQADAQALVYPDSSFDRIFSCLNLMLIPDPLAALRESARVLRSGGRAVWVVWGRAEHSPMMTLTSRALAQVGIEVAPPLRSNFHLGGLDTLKESLESLGFQSVRRWFQPMVTDVETGLEFAEMTLRLRPELTELVGEERLEAFKRSLSALTEQHLSRGEAIGLDALIVTARKP